MCTINEYTSPTYSSKDFDLWARIIARRLDLYILSVLTLLLELREGRGTGKKLFEPCTGFSEPYTNQTCKKMSSCVFWKIGDAVWHGESMTFKNATKWVEYLAEKYPDREYWVV